MKLRLYRLLPALLLLVLAGCQNLDDIYNQLKDHEDRLTKLESLTSGANDRIAALQALIDAQSQKVSIVSYTALSDGTGYTLEMSDGSTITLKNGANGKDGNTPDVGVKADADGKLYWTINGEFMLDADGKKIPAAGEDGADAVTPRLRVNTDGNWEISYDDGKRWELVTDAEGNPVKAEGSDATVDLTITEDGDNIIITYDGVEYVVPKYTEEEEPVDPGEGGDDPVVGGLTFEITMEPFNTENPTIHIQKVKVVPSDATIPYVFDCYKTSLFEGQTATQKTFTDFWYSMFTTWLVTYTGEQTIEFPLYPNYVDGAAAWVNHYIFVYGWKDEALASDLILYEINSETGAYEKVDLPKQ